jgi:hypothetical protein
MGWRRTEWVIVSVAGIAAVAYVASRLWPLIEAGPAGIHQMSVKNELAGWEREYSSVHSWRDVGRAIDLLEYAQNYYVPGPGYRGSARTEAAVEAQRARTLAAIATGLREFTGQDFGSDVARWREWYARQGRAEGR